MSTWREKSKESIQEAFLQWADVNGSMPSPSMPDVEKKRFLKMLQRWYPFGERRMLPYKMWCQETRRVKLWLAEQIVEQSRLGGLFEGNE